MHHLVCRLAELAGQELKALQANDFSSTVDISAHASGVRILVLRVLKAAVSLIKAKGKSQDQASEQFEEQDTAVTAQMGRRLEPLWTALSAAISQIEAKLPANTAPSSELPSAASSILPPGAAQVLHRPYEGAAVALCSVSDSLALQPLEASCALLSFIVSHQLLATTTNTQLHMCWLRM